jgi:hypothetical protein
MAKFLEYMKGLAKRAYLQKLEFIDTEHWVTVEDCFPLMTMTDFFAGHARLEQKDSRLLSGEEQ